MGSLVNVEEEWELENHHFSTTTVNNGSVRMINDFEARGKFWLGAGYWFAPKVSPHGLLISYTGKNSSCAVGKLGDLLTG